MRLQEKRRKEQQMRSAVLEVGMPRGSLMSIMVPKGMKRYWVISACIKTQSAQGGLLPLQLLYLSKLEIHHPFSLPSSILLSNYVTAKMKTPQRQLFELSLTCYRQLIGCSLPSFTLDSVQAPRACYL